MLDHIFTDYERLSSKPVNSTKDLIQGLGSPKVPFVDRDEHSSNQISILDMPNVESSQPCFNDPLITDRIRSNAKTPEPIVEIYSDSDDTSFDDFEKNIYNQISRRALIQSKLVGRKQACQMSSNDNELANFKVQFDFWSVSYISCQAVIVFCALDSPFFNANQF